MNCSFRSALVVVTALFVALAAGGAHALTPTTSYAMGADGKVAPSPSMVLVKDFYAALVDTMKEGPKLGFDGRYKKLEPVVSKAFNLPSMARVAVGPAWAEAPQAQRDDMIKAFSAFSVANYASRFKKFDGELFEVTGEKPLPGGVMVETKLTPKGESPVVLNYLIRNDEAGKPRIMDVYLDASISELATRRSEFSAVIKRDGMPSLISSLQEKVKKMAGNQPG